MTFTTPVALLLLLVLLPVFFLGWPRLAYRRARDVASLILRTIIILLLVFALAGLQIVRSADRLAVVFLVDASDSVGKTVQDTELAYVRDSMQHMATDDLAGVVLFGANATVERQLNAIRELGPVRSTPVTSNTDIAEAIRLGLALFPPDTARRLVILSDGQPTVGDTDAAARLASATGVEISYVPFERASSPEVQVSDVRVPASVNAGQQFDLSLTVDADAATPATITVFASGEIIHREDVNLGKGTNNYTLPLTAGGSGFRDFRVQVDPKGADGFYQNNTLSTFSQVVGPPRVLLVSTNGEESRYLADALTSTGLTVDQVTPTQLPIGVAPLAQYSSVVLADVSAEDLTEERQKILQTYVRDLGGGLVAVGGPTSFGPGGYFKTPLEETLPLESRLVDQQRIPQLTIVYVLDRSGSMSITGPSGVENLELAKEAIMRSVEFLQPTDRAGVVSFDAQAYWIANVQPVLDRIALQQLVGTIRSGGGTDILAGMQAAAETLSADPSPRKHIILLTDRGADPTGLVELTKKLYDQYDVTTSVVALGVDQTSPTFLKDMATQGGGNFHPVQIIEQIPTIFTLETVLATRSYIREQSFVPSISANSPIIDGITAAPPLLGYVATTPKQTAQVVLTATSDYNDPLLAQWQYGLGRAVAFTSDATGRWATHWLNWDGFSRFWNQAVRWTITEGKNQNIETHVTMDGEQARVEVDARDSNGGFLDGLTLSASMVDPDLGAQSIQLQQVAPGRYEATFTPKTEGAYFLAVTGQGVSASGTVDVNQRTGWVMSYSPEYALRAPGADQDLLPRVAELAHGRSLADDPAGAFAHNLTMRTASTPLYPWLLLAALLLLPADIAVRRLIVTRSDVARLRQWVSRGRGMAEAPTERLAGLMGAKARAQERADQQGTVGTSVPNTASTLRARRDATRQTQGEPPPAPPTRSNVPEPSFPAQSSKTEGGNIAAKLLEKRKAETKKDEP